MRFVYMEGDSLAQHLAEVLTTGRPNTADVLTAGVPAPSESVLLLGVKGAPVSNTGIRIIDPRKDRALVAAIPEGCENLRCHVAVSPALSSSKAAKSRAQAIEHLPEKVEYILGLRAKETVSASQPDGAQLGWYDPALQT